MELTEEQLKRITELIDGILIGDINSLSKAITLIESQKPASINMSSILCSKLPQGKGISKRIGITGIPGVGKSTFLDSLINSLADEKNKVAVLAIDPSSEISKGSILGDKTRMERISKNPFVFIRPTATSGNLGGVAPSTNQSIKLLEAAGFNTIFIETVGVGQSEIMVSHMVDFFIFLVLTGTGDELQGIKRGIMEAADEIVINKVESENLQKAKITQKQLEQALHYFPSKNKKWITKVRTCSALEEKGVLETWEDIETYFSANLEHIKSKRAQQNLFWFEQCIDQSIKQRLKSKPDFVEAFESLKSQVLNGEVSPLFASEIIVNKFLN